jgi:RNA polymerase sigma-70 factor (ECF subfamily)
METTFADQVVALRPLLVRMARQRLRNDAWAEDAVSETLVAALEHPASFGGRATVKTWLAGILKHKVVDQIRRHTRECQAEAFDDEEPEFGELHDAAPSAAFETHSEWGDPQERLSRRQFMAQLDQCLKALPPQQSRAFMLRNWMEEETDEICKQLGVTSNNLAVMLHRARNRLRSSLQAQWAAAAGGARPQWQA